MKSKLALNTQAGFSLTEILVVIVIIGILVLLAMPKFSSVITRAKTTEAKTMLKHLHTLQKTYFYEHDRYAASISDMGFEQTRLLTDGGDARYRIEVVEADALTFTARATAVVDFDKDGVFNVWEVGVEGKIVQTVAD